MSFKRIFFLIPNIFFWIFFIFEISTHVKYFRFFLKRKNESSKGFGVVHTDLFYLLEGGEVVRTLRLCAYQETIYTHTRMPQWSVAAYFSELSAARTYVRGPMYLYSQVQSSLYEDFYDVDYRSLLWSSLRRTDGFIGK